MRIFALSDIHVDYAVNMAWVASLSRSDYLDDVLILAGDVSHSTARLEQCLSQLATRFKKLLFVPGNHDLWVIREAPHLNSIDKFHRVREISEHCGASMVPYHHRDLSVVPMLGWYDYSFGIPQFELQRSWVDFHACRWPAAWTMADVTSFFLQMNDYRRRSDREVIVSFSHFLPSTGIMPPSVSDRVRQLFPVLGTTQLEQQVLQLRSTIHVYGHSHLNRRVLRDGVLYVNNAFGYPHETRIAAKMLHCVYDTSAV